MAAEMESITHRTRYQFIHSIRRLQYHSSKTSMYSDQLYKIVTTLNVHMERMGLAESRICCCGRGIDDEHHFFFECSHYHEFRQLLEQSVQDTLLTGPNSVAVNLTVSLLLAPWTNNNLSWRPHLYIFNKLVGDSEKHHICSFQYFCINKTAK